MQQLEQQHSEAVRKRAEEKRELLKVNHMMAQELKAVVDANEELHRLREGAEGREANMEGELRLEKQLHEELELRLAESRSLLDQVVDKVDSIVVEEMLSRMRCQPVWRLHGAASRRSLERWCSSRWRL